MVQPLIQPGPAIQAGQPASEPAPTGPAPTGLAPTATAPRLVAEWLSVGGLMAPGLGAVRPPALVVYADGRVIADAAHELRLPPAEVEALVKALDDDLAGQPVTVSPRPGRPTVMDAPTTILGVDSGAGMREVHVPYLKEAGTTLVDAHDRLARLADRATAEGRPYAGDRVRLFTEQSHSTATTAKPLPDEAPLTQSRPGRKDYKGNKARTIARLIPHDGSWHVYRTSTGRQIALSWRYLLPHE
jgi:hypothetical protein